MAVLLSVCVALVGVMLGDLGSIPAECVRLNSAQLSYRLNRLPSSQHCVLFFGGGVIIFGLIALVRSRNKTNYESKSLSRSDPRLLH